MPDETRVSLFPAPAILWTLTPRKIARQVLADVLKNRVDVFQRCFAVMDRQIGQVETECRGMLR
ncbi:hypothetical protein CN200_30435 [Sinorhizobium meliloti]|nr:hypothetical protein CN200_30435 [Sinorhizobium meliloti]RVK25055.1 hypothetical protein CN161_32830 [Sinorhizobium meliloti]RVN78881.1 hypothetical protein CN107_32020 [Sinorhizobium meliloti]RVO29880.1 hypothetical protein CN093_33770 [Sinorhizobium meliloti]RVO86142.1 hypothetical protein CN089_34285 [Sinorhizobium meliloti]